MGLSTSLILFPLIVLGISVMMQTGHLATNAGGSQAFCNPNTGCGSSTGLTQYNCASGTTVCFQGDVPTNAAITCSGGDANSNGFDGAPACYLTTLCHPGPSPVYCYLGSFLYPTAGTFLPAGQTIVTGGSNGAILGGSGFLPGTQIVSTSSSTFTFGALGITGFIGYVAIAIGIAVVAGLAVLGSGLSPEAIHVVFMGGILLGLWVLLSGAEGIFGNSSGSLFVSLNAIAGLGSSFYIVLTLFYSIGVVGAISRGGTN